jgi:hypothetical protein
MKRYLPAVMITILCCLFLADSNVRAQAEPEKSQATKYEVGVQFTALTIDAFQVRTQPGFGMRFTYNFNDYIAAEAQTDFFPNDDKSVFSRNGGRAWQGLAGVKIGKRFKTFGIFGKVRPGFIKFTRGVSDLVITGPPPAGSTFPLFDVNTRSATHFVTDIGGVLEVYASRRIVTRFDAGAYIIRYGASTFQSFTGTSTAPVLGPVTDPGQTKLNFQFSAGIGYRF